MIILAIETSCDETSVAVVKAEGGLRAPKFKILSNIILSQIKTHAKWGGVVPSLAKREHSKNLIPILKKSLKKSGFLKLNLKSKILNLDSNTKKRLEKILKREPDLLEQFLEFIPKIKVPKIDVIAVTIGPGLEPALWVGINFAKALSLIWNKPVIAVNHMEGHIAASLLSERLKAKSEKKIEFPAIALLVSGGHTELVLVKKWGDYKIVGETRDDAAGECFDKTARMLGLSYPGGPSIAKLASQCKSQITIRQLADKLQIKLPHPMINSDNYDFSFSGLKTAVLYLLKNLEKKVHKKSDRLKLVPFICGEFQQAVINVLIAKTMRVTEEFKAKTIILGGGVAANKELRKQMAAAIKKSASWRTSTTLYLPSPKLTTDNAAMIAAAGYLRALNNDFIRPAKLKAQGNLTFK